jgi:hypothetical protein
LIEVVAQFVERRHGAKSGSGVWVGELSGYYSRMRLPAQFLPDPLPADPLPLAVEWLALARQRRDQPNPNAMVIATVDSNGQPSARVVLCKDLSPVPGSITFFTNYDSHKGRELAANPRVAIVMHSGSPASPVAQLRVVRGASRRPTATPIFVHDPGSDASVRGRARKAVRSTRVRRWRKIWRRRPLASARRCPDRRMHRIRRTSVRAYRVRRIGAVSK